LAFFTLIHTQAHGGIGEHGGGEDKHSVFFVWRTDCFKTQKEARNVAPAIQRDIINDTPPI